jgi:hypothetical protein
VSLVDGSLVLDIGGLVGGPGTGTLTLNGVTSFNFSDYC